MANWMATQLATHDGSARVHVLLAQFGAVRIRHTGLNSNNPRASNVLFLPAVRENRITGREIWVPWCHDSRKEKAKVNWTSWGLVTNHGSILFYLARSSRSDGRASVKLIRSRARICQTEYDITGVDGGHVRTLHLLCAKRQSMDSLN